MEDQLSIIKDSNQMWKIFVFLIITALCGATIIFQSLLYAPIGKSETMVLVIAATILGILTFVWASFSIKCPNCKSKFVWYAVSKLNSGKWLSWLLSSDKCPTCGYSNSQNKI
jgi:hypothetical protein